MAERVALVAANKTMLNPKGLSRQILLLSGGDFIVACTSAYMAGYAMPLLDGRIPLSRLSMAAVVLGVSSVVSLYLRDLYRLDLPRTAGRVVRATLGAQVLLAVMMPIGLFALSQFPFGRRFVLAYFLISVSLMTLWRLGARRLLAAGIRIGVAVLGTDKEATLVAREVLHRQHIGYVFLGFAAHHQNESRRPSPADPESKTSDLPCDHVDKLLSHAALAVLVIANHEPTLLPCREMLRLKLRGVEVIDLQSFYERLTGRLPTAILSDTWLALAPGFYRTKAGAIVKRVADLVAAAMIGLLAFPIAVLTAIAIKLDSRGPVFYSQPRVGLDGRVFHTYKFRSMRQDAEKDSGPVWASRSDARETRVGRYLRRAHIDEIPQLFNVFRGDMSLVGPRPERPEFVSLLRQQISFYDYRHLIRPGLTGWAQICYPYGASVDDAHTKLCYDLYYIKNWSLGFDLQILFQTIKLVLFARGSTPGSLILENPAAEIRGYTEHSAV